MFKDKIRKIDIEAIIKFVISYPCSFFVRRKHPRMWIISERPGEARDNGYALYKYIRDNHSDMDVYYVIRQDGIDRKKVELEGNIIDFYSIKHYIYYLSAYGHASAHVDAGTPNSRVSNFLERKGLLKNKKIFLLHGITKDLLPFCFYNSTRADVICCQTKIEKDYVNKYFGYPKENVQQTGMARFDNLLCEHEVKQQILVMPTWRAWLAEKEFATFEEAKKNFQKSQYFKNYNALLSNQDLKVYLEKNDLDLIFYVHPDMQPYWNMFTSDCEKIQIADAKKYDVQKLLMESKVLLTDYSSVFFDFAYMFKPILFFHFDYEEYRSKQHPEGYYDYKNGFGPVLTDVTQVIQYLKVLSANGYVMEKKYREYTDNFFDIRDQNSCERIYQVMTKL